MGMCASGGSVYNLVVRCELRFYRFFRCELKLQQETIQVYKIEVFIKIVLLLSR